MKLLLVNVTVNLCWQVNIGSGKGLVPRSMLLHGITQNYHYNRATMAASKSTQITQHTKINHGIMDITAELPAHTQPSLLPWIKHGSAALPTSSSHWPLPEVTTCARGLHGDKHVWTISCLCVIVYCGKLSYFVTQNCLYETSLLKHLVISHLLQPTLSISVNIF